MRTFSQTPGPGSDEPDDEKERLPEAPPAPELPEAPRLQPKLPPRLAGEPSREAEQYRRMGIAYTVPIALITPVILLTALGWWLDRRFGKSPFFTLAGALAGVVSGFINMIRIAQKLNE